jgi:hypothetical protein
MKRSISSSLFVALIGLAACNGGEPVSQDGKKADSALLSTSVVNNPRSAEGTNPVAIADMATMDFADTVHDFGDIKEGEIVTYNFEFTNNGKSPLIISGATGSCGCTVPTYPQDAIAPGKTEVLKVRFDSNHKTGHQEKTVTVKTNSSRGEHLLVIKAEVAESKGKDLKNLNTQ